MDLGVDRILEQRLHREGRRFELKALGAALALHLVAVAALLIGPSLGREPLPPPQFADVRLVPLQRLGSPDAPPEPAPEPEPEAEQPPPPEPEPPPAPRAETPRSEPEPEPEAPPPTPPPSSREASREPDEPSPDAVAGRPGRRGSPEGSPAGVSSFGAAVGTMDASFKYDYYIDRMLSAIEARWKRPRAEEEIEATLHFRIARDGSVSELRIVRPSGFNAFDLAALRAVEQAAPFPPLPRSYRKDSLGVQLIVR